MGLRMSTLSRYGLRAMIELSKRKGEGFVSLKEISKNQRIPMRYLENIMLRLLATGLVKSTRGKGGGFALTRDPSEIKVSEIIRALEGDLSLVPCLDDSSVCDRSLCCETRPLWKELRERILEVLEKRRLSDLFEKEEDER